MTEVIETTPETEPGGSFAEVLKLFSAGSPGGGAEVALPRGMDPMMALMWQMQREASQNMMKLALVVVPKLFERREDPVLTKLLEKSLDSGKATEHMEGLLRMSSQNGADQIKFVMETMASTQAMRDKAMMDMMERRAEVESESTGGLAGILRELRLAAEAMNATPLDAPPEAPAAPVPAAAMPAPAAPSAPVPPVAMVLLTLRKMWMERGRAPAEEIHAMLAGIAARDSVLRAAVVAGDRNGLVMACQPHVMERQELKTWLVLPGVEQWLHDYVAKQLRPRLAAAAQAQAPAPAARVARKPDKVVATKKPAKAVAKLTTKPAKVAKAVAKKAAKEPAPMAAGKI